MKQKKAQTRLITGATIAVFLIVGVLILFSGNKDSEILGNLVNVQEQTEDIEEMIVSESKTYTVDIANFAYEPKELRIKQGDSVVWTNMDSVGHTVTSDTGNELDSKLFGKGESYSHVFNEKGTYEYHCKPHLFMKAKVIVE